MSDKDKLKGWADSLDGEEDEGGVQADIARKILALNPKLRDAGLDTGGMVEKTKQRDAQPAATPRPAGASVPSGNRIIDAFSEVKKQLDSDERRADAEIARLQKERVGAKTQALDRVMRWLSANDPDLRSPVTQAMLADEKAFLERIGFSIKRYMDAQKKSR